MQSEERQHFKVQSYLAELSEDGERPPRSAKFVVDLDLGSSPGGGDYRTYLLSTDRKRSLWILWLRGNDWHKPLYCRVAAGQPYRGYPAKYAAEQLLMKSWQDERGIGEVPPYVSVLQEGLLTKADIRRIKLTVFGED
jgi:hypothetical protein